MPGSQGFTGNNDTSGPDGLCDRQQTTRRLAVGDTELWAGEGPRQVWVLDPTREL